MNVIKKSIKIVLSVLFSLMIIFTITFLLLWNGIILLNNPSQRQYPIRGIDVSSYQGEVDWNVISEQNISFAYIKATEGSSHTDKYFENNYNKSGDAGIKRGAYHFFSFESPGKTQAEHFISVVPLSDNALPPVVDLEFYGKFFKSKPDKEQVMTELGIFLDIIEEHYGVKPIIYVTEKSYEYFLSGSNESYSIWIRSVIFAPKLSDGREWTIWQYTNRGRLDGYSGSENFIDINVFNGSPEEFDNLGN